MSTVVLTETPFTADAAYEVSPPLGYLVTSPTGERSQSSSGCSPLQLVAARFALDLSTVSVLSFTEIWEQLLQVPDNLLALLQTAHGWTVLSHYIAGVSLKPSVH